MDEGTDRQSCEEELYDAYLELALAGDAPEPDVFLAERGGGSGELLTRLEELARASVHPTKIVDDGSLPFESLGEYRLIERIGRGGMGLVFLAEQTALERKVALKLLRPELSGSNLFAERFKREARAIAKLRHPNIVAVYGFGEASGVRYLAMEYVPGRTLEEELRVAPVALARKVRWIRDLARALHYAHEQGTIHRDVKPSNVRVTPDDRVLLIDFGLVRNSTGESATLTDTFAGSPTYASPEQIADAARVDRRTDVYSLGVTLYRCLTGVAPFEGDSVEQVFHRILVGRPVAPRKIDPTIPRDLEVVTLKAMEHDPTRRYATAAEFADDLEAVLELRPIRARPPNPVQRALRGAKHHKALATFVLTAGAALLAFASFTFVSAARAAQARRAEARDTVARARRRVDAYRESRAEFAGAQREVERLNEALQYDYLPPERMRALDAMDSRVEELARSWQTAYYEVLDLLREAERVDPDVEGAELVRAELYREKYREATAALRNDEAEFYRALIEQHDPDGVISDEIQGNSVVSIDSDPAGATVYLFQYVEHSKLVPGGERRMVPVPVGDEAPVVAPGTWCLRVLEARGELAVGDHVVEIAGHGIEHTVLVVRAPPPLELLDRIVSVDDLPFDDAWAVDNLGPLQPSNPDGSHPERTFVFQRGSQRLEVRGRSLEELGIVVAAAADFAERIDRAEVDCLVHRDGRLLPRRLPPGTPVRATAAALLSSERCNVGSTPLHGLAIRPGNYLALLRRRGYEDRRVPFAAAPGALSYLAHLDELGSSPPGFVRLAPEPAADRARAWISEHEITSGEYREFLNHPSTLDRIDRSPEPILFPRQNYTGVGVPLWRREYDGTWHLPRGWSDDFPVVGVAWSDAVEYARWRTERAREQGLDLDFALPDAEEFMLAGVGRLPLYYSWGTHFRPGFARTCFSRPRAGPGPVLQFPVDESPIGAFDFCGGASEWIDGWYDRARGLRHSCGGAWGQSSPDTNKVTGGNGVPNGGVTGETGFRLIARGAQEQR